MNGEAEDDYSGYCVSINHSGNVVAIGARHNGDGGRDAGHVRIFEWNGSAWVQMGSDIDGEAGGDISGLSVGLNGRGILWPLEPL